MSAVLQNVGAIAGLLGFTLRLGDRNSGAVGWLCLGALACLASGGLLE